MTRWIVVSEGEGYKTRAKRIDTAAYSIVVVEWVHPNAGYWADAGLWINSLHSSTWVKHSNATWFHEITSLDEFIKQYPKFKQLFGETPRDRLFNKIRGMAVKELSKSGGDMEES